MSDNEDIKVDEAQETGLRRVSARVAARAASKVETESKQVATKDATTKKRASVGKEKPKPNKKVGFWTPSTLIAFD